MSNDGLPNMTTQRALAEVHRDFCADDGTHDDACRVLGAALTIPLRDAMAALRKEADERGDLDERAVTWAIYRLGERAGAIERSAR